MSEKIYKVIVIPDSQIPFHCRKSFRAIEKYMADETWDEYLHIGDLMDFDQLSRWNKGSAGLIQGRELSKDYAEVNRILDRHQSIVRKNNPKAKFTLLLGNHDIRPEKYTDDFPQLKGTIEIEHGLRLMERGFKVVRCYPDGEVYRIGKAHFIHGLYTGGNHAKKTVDAFGKSIFYGHCVSEDTRLLGKDGWLNYGDLMEGKTEVATFNKESGKMEWNTVKKVHLKESWPEVYAMKTGHSDLIATDYHGMIGYKARSKTLELYPLEDFGKKAQRVVLHSAEMEHAGIDLTDDELRLLIWVCADAHLTPSGQAVWGIKKERKIRMLRELLRRMGLCGLDTHRSGETWISVQIRDFAPKVYSMLAGKKELPEQITECDKKQSGIVIETYGITDGHMRGDSVRCYSTRRIEMDRFQRMCVLNGWRCSLGVQHNEHRNPKHSPLYVCNVNPRNTTVIQTKNYGIDKVPYSGKVYCVTVDNGTILTERNGRTLITQNTHDVSSHSKVLWGDGSAIVGQSLGCSCDYELDYVGKNPKNWQKAVTTFFFSADGNFSYYVSRIFNGTFIAPNGKTYRG